MGWSVNRATMRNILKTLDPEGAEHRSIHSLKGRIHWSKGPNYIWHIDGYDKLKPFGFCIHGAIDGNSRRILWLKVGSSHKKPNFFGEYFLDCLV